MIFFWLSNAAMAFLVMAQTLVMVSMFYRSRHSLLMPWKIVQIGKPGRTVEQSMSSTTIKLISAYLGEARRALMKLSCQYDWTWLLLPMADTFNIKIMISQPKWNEPKQAVNAFAMWMASQWLLCQLEKRTEHNSPDQLYIQCNTGFAVRKETEFPFRRSRLQQWGQSSEIPSRVFVVLDGQHS